MGTDATSLDKWRLFADLSSDETTFVLGACEERMLVGGEDLFLENDPGDSMWIVQSGRVEIYKRIRGDVDRALASFGPGDVIGEMSVIDGSRRSAGARTTEPSEFLVLTRAGFAKLQRDQPSVAAGLYRNMAAILAARLRTTNELYKEAVLFGIEATGATSLNLKALTEELRPVTIYLSGGFSVQGRVLQMDHHPAGYTLVVKDRNDRMAIIPYHAIQRIEVA